MQTSAGRQIIVAPRLPYDAAVDYIESTGTQWIDTGVVTTLTTSCNIRGYFPHTLGSARFGSRETYEKNMFCFGGPNANQIRIDIGDGSDNRWIATTTTAATAIAMSVKTHSAQVTLIDGSTVSHTFQQPIAYTKALSIFIFAFNQDGLATRASSMQVSGCQIFEESTLVRDYIPVRVGSGASAVGFLYDRANPNGGPLGNGFYGSANPDSLFIGSCIGPDKR